MNFRRYMLLVAALCAAIVSCKKSEDETTKSYLDGDVSLDTDMPFYVAIGEEYTFTPSGLSDPDGEYNVGYYFYDSIDTDQKDTVQTTTHPAKSFVYTVPDTLGTFTISCVGFAEGGSEKYYTTSATYTFITVDPELNNGSIKGFPLMLDDKQVFLHGDRYFSRTIGNYTWIRQNLAYNSGIGRLYYDSPVMRTVFGAFYTWEEAQKACPSGWRLPSDKEFLDLAVAAGASSDIKEFEDTDTGAGNLISRLTFNGEEMWEFQRYVKMLDKTGITAMPVGYATVKGDSYEFHGGLEYAAWWTSSEKDGKGAYRYIINGENSIYSGFASKTAFAISVRCIR